MSEIALEKRVRKIERCVLAKVFYQRAPFAVRPPAAWSTNDPHPVEAAYLETDSGRFFKFYWADEFHLRHGFGVSLVETRVIDRDAGPIEDVSAELAWRTLVGQRVTTTYVHWKSISAALRSTFRIMVSINADHLSRCDYPATIQLDFERGEKKYFSAATLRENGEVVRFTNNLLITDRADRVSGIVGGAAGN